MRRKFFLLVFGLLLFASFRQDKPALEFMADDLIMGLNQANFNNKPLFVFAYGQYCHICKGMVSTTLTNADVIKMYQRNFINVKLNVSDVKNHYQMTNWGLKQTPSFVFFSPKGKIIYTSSGFKDSQKMLYMAEIALRKCEMWKTAQQNLAK